MILPAFESVPTWSVDWGLRAIVGNKMPPRDDDDDEEEEEDDEDEDLEPPVVREPELDE